MPFEKGASDPNNNLNSVKNTPHLSVIINTFNRDSLLKTALESLVEQTLDKKDYEVIIIDDGSDDQTKENVYSFFDRLPIKYFYQKNAGRSSAKNHGIYAAQGRILFFLDDDDIATPTLLEEHINSHDKYPDDNYAVLNYTGWSPSLTLTPLMHYITEVGHLLFSYPNIKHGDILDYTYFWAGRLSCKRSFLIEYGVFNPIVRICEDIELGFRLSRYNLKVVYNAKAVSMANRAITLHDFCKRLILRGRDQYILSRLHQDPGLHKWAEVMGSEEEWEVIRPIFNAKIRSTFELDKIANLNTTYGFSQDNLTSRLLHNAYKWTFKACKIKGIMAAKEDSAKSMKIKSERELANNSSSNVDIDVKYES